MNYDYSKRGYLLPEGCKDLIDVSEPKPPIVPDFKIVVTEKGLLIQAQLPQLQTGAVVIAVEERKLRLAGKHSQSLVPFEGTVEVPEGFDLTRAEATYFSGELRIVIPKQ